MLSALTRGVSPTIGDCKLTFMERERIDVAAATRQHEAYRQCLTKMGVQITSLDLLPDAPDAVFIQDTAVVVDEVAIVATMGAACRAEEVESVAQVLSLHRPLKRLSPPATLEGGDIVRIGRTLYVGDSGRTNRDGIRQLSEMLAPYDYQVIPAGVRGCLHLSTGCSYLGRGLMLLNPVWVDAAPFQQFEILEVPETESWAANTIAVGDTVLMASAFERTCALVQERGFNVIATDISELQKAEGALTCMSLMFDARHQ
ncbi:MAG TPA: arginine deiminase-related protein [Pyrinomonadaceae bacterium]|nr:arginine deiminase-related protein [Pyrinomonadaceae bacterium]